MTTQITDRAVELLALAESTPEDKLASVLVFDGRDSYVAFVEAWKCRHADVVAEIRGHKAERRDKGRGTVERNASQERRQGLRPVARHLYAVRSAGKEKARAEREARTALAA